MSWRFQICRPWCRCCRRACAWPVPTNLLFNIPSLLSPTYYRVTVAAVSLFAYVMYSDSEVTEGYLPSNSFARMISVIVFINLPLLTLLNPVNNARMSAWWGILPLSFWAKEIVEVIMKINQYEDMKNMIWASLDYDIAIVDALYYFFIAIYLCLILAAFWLALSVTLPCFRKKIQNKRESELMETDRVLESSKREPRTPKANASLTNLQKAFEQLRQEMKVEECLLVLESLKEQLKANLPLAEVDDEKEKETVDALHSSTHSSFFAKSRSAPKNVVRWIKMKLRGEKLVREMKSSQEYKATKMPIIFTASLILSLFVVLFHLQKVVFRVELIWRPVVRNLTQNMSSSIESLEGMMKVMYGFYVQSLSDPLLDDQLALFGQAAAMGVASGNFTATQTQQIQGLPTKMATMLATMSTLQEFFRKLPFDANALAAGDFKLPRFQIPYFEIDASLPDMMNGLDYFFKILFLVILVSSFLSFLLVLITLWRQQTHFKTTLYRMRNAQEHLIENYSPSLYYVSKAPLFLGTQVSTTFVGFYLVLGVLSIAGVGLVFVFLFFAGNIEKSLQTSVQLILPAALSILLKYFLEKKIARAKLSNGFIITHPILFTWYSAFMLVFGLVTGLFTAIKRFLIQLLLYFPAMFRLDRTPFPPEYAALDKGWIYFMSLVALERRHNSPSYRAKLQHFISGRVEAFACQNPGEAFRLQKLHAAQRLGALPNAATAASGASYDDQTAVQMGDVTVDAVEI